MKYQLESANVSSVSRRRANRSSACGSRFNASVRARIRASVRLRVCVCAYPSACVHRERRRTRLRRPAPGVLAPVRAFMRRAFMCRAFMRRAFMRRAFMRRAHMRRRPRRELPARVRDRLRTIRPLDQETINSAIGAESASGIARVHERARVYALKS